MRFRYVVALLVSLSLSACAGNAPPSLSPAGITIWQANEVVVAVGTLQTVAINLNKVQICEPAPCHPLLSDDNTRAVVEIVTDGLTSIRQLPSGWKAVGTSVVDRVDGRLDAAGQSKLKAYTAAVRVVIGGL